MAVTPDTTPDFGRFVVNEENRRRVQERQPSRRLPRSSWCLIRFYTEDGTPLLMTRGYLRTLAEEGFIGLQSIPRECIVP